MVKKPAAAARTAEEASPPNTHTNTSPTTTGNPSRRTELLRVAAIVIFLPVLVGLSSGDTIKHYLEEPALDRSSRISAQNRSQHSAGEVEGEVDLFASEQPAAIVTTVESSTAALETAATMTVTAAPITAPPITAPPVTAPPASLVVNPNPNNNINNDAIHPPLTIPPPPTTAPAKKYLPLPLSPELVRAALQFVQGRERAYREADQQKHWKLRGIGYLYSSLTIALAARTVTIEGGRRRQVQIFNVHPQLDHHHHPSEGPNYCDLLTIWVRANGPELVAGKARPVAATDSSACHWVWDLDLTVPGTYTVDARVVLWNGLAPLHFYPAPGDPQQTNACPRSFAGNTVVPPTEQQQAMAPPPQNTSLLGFKMYDTFGACCEVCRRTRGCQYWATPPAILPAPSGLRTGCELWFPSSTPREDIPTTRLLPDIIQGMNEQILQQQQQQRKAKDEAAEAAILAANATAGPQRLRRRHRRHRRRRLVEAKDFWGSSESNVTSVAQFLGCGWSFFYTLEFPCLSGDFDDMVFVENNGTIVVTTPADPPTGVPTVQQLPLCQTADESILQQDTGVFAHKGRWVREPWPTEDTCPDPYRAANLNDTELNFHMNEFSADRPHCWHRYDLTSLNKRCFEMNCPMIQPHGKWLSAPLQQESQWMGAWKNYQCDYLEFTNQQLAECFQTKKITEIRYEGASIGNNFNQFFSVRLQNVPFYRGTDGKFVTVSSLKWPHLLWHFTADVYKSLHLEEKPNLESVANTDETYWVTPYFITSEREPYVQMERAMEFAHNAEAILTAKGYTMINAFDLSAAFTVRKNMQAVVQCMCSSKCMCSFFFVVVFINVSFSF